MEKKVESKEITVTAPLEAQDELSGFAKNIAVESVVDKFEKEIMDNEDHMSDYTLSDVQVDVECVEGKEANTGLFFKKMVPAVEIIAKASGVISNENHENQGIHNKDGG